ncbi:hypothetical protein BH23GEM6_BH23GEM6_01740 [soil metagenome]
MTSLLLTAYFGIALLATLNCMARAAWRRRGPLATSDSLDPVILFLTSVVASVLWAPLLMIHVTGWATSGRGKRYLNRLAARARLRPEPVFRDRIYHNLP